jgi:hypothetical protein
MLTSLLIAPLIVRPKKSPTQCRPYQRIRSDSISLLQFLL